MKLFENGVGRPSNDTIKKRRIFYVILFLCVALILCIGTYLLTNINNFNMLKSNVSIDNAVNFIFTAKENRSSKTTELEKVIGVNDEQIFSGRLSNDYLLELHLKNNSKSELYYRIYYYTKDEISKNTYDFSTKCEKVKVGENVFKDANVISINSNVPIRKVLAKVFLSKSSCQSDTYGIINENNSISKSVVLYNKLSAVHIVKFVNSMLSNDSKNHINYKVVKYGESLYTPSANVPVGYSFNGWKISKKLNNDNYYYGYDRKNKLGWYKQSGIKKYYLYSVGSKLSSLPNGEILLETEATKATKFTVNYNSNGGKGSMKSQQITYGKSTRLKLNTFTKSRYKFTGWVAKRNSDGYIYGYDSKGIVGWYKSPSKNYVYKNIQKVSKTVPAGQTVTMYAQWKKR